MPTLAGISPIIAAAAAGGGDNPLLRVSPGLWIWTLLIFACLLFVLGRWGWPLLIDKLDARDRSIRGAIEEARAEREEAEKLLKEQRALLEETRRKTTEMLAEAQSAAKLERQRIVAEARNESERIVSRGREQIEQETRNALAQIRSSVAQMAIQVAERLLPRTVDASAHRQLAEQFVNELESRSERGGKPS
jgi:F-type H+-transporting ATPase subunit b